MVSPDALQPFLYNATIPFLDSASESDHVPTDDLLSSDGERKEAEDSDPQSEPEGEDSPDLQDAALEDGGASKTGGNHQHQLSLVLPLTYFALDNSTEQRPDLEDSQTNPADEHNTKEESSASADQGITN